MKLNLKFLALVIIITLVSACVTSNIKYNNEGYSIVDIHKSLNDVYAKTLRLIESDQVSNSGSDSYTMNTNQKSDKKALILAVNDNNPNDFVEVVMQKASADTTRLAVKYGKENSVKSALFISLVQEG